MNRDYLKLGNHPYGFAGLIVVFIVIALVFTFGTYAHEKIHEMIYEHGGGKNITIELRQDLKWVTTCNDCRNYSDEDYLFSLHVLNEIESYNSGVLKCILSLNLIVLYLILLRL